MQHDPLLLLERLGELVKHTRAQRMDQEELAQRAGVSRSTISAIESGKGVNSKALCSVLTILGLSDLFLLTAERQLELLAQLPQRKLRKPTEELPNDF